MSEQLSELDMWLWFGMGFGPANPRKWNVYGKYQDIENCYNSVTEMIARGDGSKLYPRDFEKIKKVTPESIKKLKDLCDKNGIKICRYGDELYPENLMEIYNPPAVLFYLGDISALNRSLCITVVGTRKPSKYSVKVCNKICTDLAKKGVAIVSGFALGLDSVAHYAAINTDGGVTFAILSSGILYDYPKDNAKSKKLLSEHGALISEYFPNDASSTISFHARNRILSGISHGTLIIQAGAKSGSLSTASFATSQGRDIFCVPPHDILDPAYDGVKSLIRSGAISVMSAEDISESYGYEKSFADNRRQVTASSPDDQKPKTRSKKKPQAKKSPSAGQVSESMSDISADRPKHLIPVPTVPVEELSGGKLEIYNYLKEHGESNYDDVASAKTGDPLELDAIITELELEGLIETLPGNRLKLC